MRTKKIDVPLPSSEQVEYYLRAWDELENYHLQEDALDKLFFKLCPENTDMSDILLKVAALNDFYSTNIFSVYPVAKHILSLNIDDRLKIGDAFEKAGYTVIQQPASLYRFDLLIEKAGKQYAIEIKDYRGQAYLHVEHLHEFLSGSEKLLPGIERVLFIDTSKVTKAVGEKEKEIENFRIVDLSQVKELLQDNPVDILVPAEE